MTEKISTHKKFEQNDYIETEQKFLPLHPEKLDSFRLGAAVIEQVYLSHPDEEFTLRIRETTKAGQTEHVATLKTDGELTDAGLSRLEFEAPVSAERFAFYNHDVPAVRKLRAEPTQDVVIDFFEGGYIHVESENPNSWRRFIEQYGFENDFMEVTGSHTADNEWIAHEQYRRTNGGRSAFDTPSELDTDEMVDTILRRRGIVTLGGRSGSGKTTILNEVRDRLHEQGLTTASISTDDYNHGKTYLERLGGGSWSNYDANETYNLPLCLLDLRRLKYGEAIARRVFDFQTEEQLIDGEIAPADVTFVEGIKAHHPVFRELADFSFTVPTPLATSIGRRILRDLEHRPRTADPSSNLAMYLEYAEPEYRALL